jgi:hypothetical protein
MSWSVSAIGKLEAVKAKATAEFGKLDDTLRGEDLELKKKAESIVMSCLEAQSPGSAVRLECGGKVAPSRHGGQPIHRLNLLLEPIEDFAG